MCVFRSLGVDLFELRCPDCKEISQMQLTRWQKVMTVCPSCKSELVLTPKTVQKPNGILFQMGVVSLTALQKQQEKKLKVAA